MMLLDIPVHHAVGAEGGGDGVGGGGGGSGMKPYGLHNNTNYTTDLSWFS